MEYKIHNLANIISIDAWSLLFNECPQDKYVTEGFRYKQLSWLNFDSNNNLQILPHAPLIQSKSFNQIHGDIVRHYPPISNKLLLRADFLSCLGLFRKTCNLTTDKIILTQLQRIDCSKDKIGHPAIEGFHHDGIDWLGLMVISRNNISGAETLLKNLKGEIVFQQTLQPGELLIVNDKKMLHYTTPIKPLTENISYGYRDVVIISACAKDQMYISNVN